MSGRLDHIVVVGRDHALWLAAAVLRSALGAAGVGVSAVELPAAGPAGTALATLPPLHGLHARIGLQPDALLAVCAGTASLGVELAGFSGPGSRTFLPYGGHGPDVAGASFASIYARARRAGLKVGFDDFSLNAAAARQGRFFVADRETAAYTLCDSAAHLDGASYTRMLRRQALASGVEPIPARDATIVRRPDTGQVSSLRLDGGRQVMGDLYVDCVGLEEPGENWRSWRAWFPFGRLLGALAPPLATLPAYGRAQAAPHGIVHLRPLRNRTAVLFAFDPDALTDDDALREAQRETAMRLDAPAARDLAPGVHDRPWRGNLVAVGEAAARFDPLFHPELHALQMHLTLLATLLPHEGPRDACAAAFNREAAGAAARLRDLQIAPLKLNRAGTGATWAAMRSAAIPPPLQEKLDLFGAIGEVDLQSHETFLQDSWAALLFGLGLEPEAYGPLADLLTDAALAAELQSRLRFVKARVEAMSSHGAWIEMHAAGAHA